MTFKDLSQMRTGMTIEMLSRIRRIETKEKRVSKAVLTKKASAVPDSTEVVQAKTATASGYEFRYAEVSGASSYAIYRGTDPNRPDLAELIAQQPGTFGDPSPKGRLYQDTVSGTYYYWVSARNEADIDGALVNMK